MRRCMNCFKDVKDGLDVCPFCGYYEADEQHEVIHMAAGTLLGERYLIGRVIGYGGFGVTYAAWDNVLEQKVAIKEYFPKEFSTRMPGSSTITVFNGNKTKQYNDGLNKFVEEARKIAKFQEEEGIVKVYDCISENETAYIIMEYLEGETLKSFLEREGTVPEETAFEMMKPIMKSLEAVHAAGILHRDIAPDNIFITKDGDVKLIDFGASRFATTSHSRSLTVIVKPGYSPEEQYRSRGDQGPHTDVYSIAATMYKMVTGITPPDALERRASVENSRRDTLENIRRINSKVSLRFENAVLNALNVRIEDRTATIPQFWEELTSERPVKRRYGKIRRIDFYRWPVWLKVTAPALATLIVVFGVLIATGVISFTSLFSTAVKVPDGYVIVPLVEGLNTEEAIKSVVSSKLNYRTGGSVVSEFWEADTVVYQSPNQGTYLIENGVMELVVSRGTGEVKTADQGISTVPYVVWSTEDVATQDLTTAGLTYRIEYVYDENVSEGQVISACLEDGTVVNAGDQFPEGTVIILYVSLGSEGFAMPSLVGMTESAAKAALTDLGLIVSVEQGIDSSVNPGEVYWQSASEGEIVHLGDVITIRVAAEEKEELISVPNVVGSTEEVAQDTLKNAGFSVMVIENNSDSVAEGIVMGQTPSSGSLQNEGAQIVIEVSKGPVKIQVPNVVGKEETNARSTLSTAGLESSVSYEYSEDVASGNVISQSVSAGTEVVLRTSVSLVISKGSEYINVPNVVGMSEADSTAALSNAGIAYEITRVEDNSVPRDSVISQSESGNCSIRGREDTGIVISLTISRGYYPTSVSVSKTSASLEIYETVDLDYSYSPSNTTVDDCSWSTSDSSVATVDESGVVSAVYPGTAIITATSYNASGSAITATCEVTVKAPTISLSSTSLSIGDDHGGDDTSVTVSVTPANQEYTIDYDVTCFAARQEGDTIYISKIDRGYSEIDVSVTVNGYTVSETIGVYCYEYDYGWGETYSSSTQLSTGYDRQLVNTTYDTVYEVGLDYYNYSGDGGNRWFYAYGQNTTRTLRYHLAVDMYGGDYLWVTADSNYVPIGYTPIAPGGNTLGWGADAGYNKDSRTGYANGRGCIFFVVDTNSYNTNYVYYYQDWVVVGCSYN